MRTELLEYLICPTCRASAWHLSENLVRDEEIVTGHLFCSACQTAFEIVEGIPCLLSEKPAHWTLETDDEFEAYPLEATPTIAELIAKHSGGVNLDAGCGRGAYIPQFRGTVIALDVHFPLVFSLQQSYGFRENLHCVVGDVRKLPFKDSLFDFSNCSQVLEHLEPDEFDVAVRELGRVTSGIVQVDSPNENLFTDLVRWLIYHDHRTLQRGEEALHYELYHHNRTNASLLRSRGFSTYGCLGWVTHKRLRRRGFAGKLVVALYEALSWRISYLSGTVIGIKDVRHRGSQ